MGPKGLSKTLVVLGTRPEAIKLAPVIVRLRGRPELGRCLVCSTGQHREMLDQTLKTFGIVPDMDLDVMLSGQSLAALAARLFWKIDAVLESEEPSWVLVQGDTLSAMAAAVVAFYRRIKVAHVEAGL
ncbi:MAG: UDP-N-acetylglucosamine 2-epimerase, partial [Candidatus Brocadiae bacterium]|nr:UDP-N-acetylglucosamine 2-epimerase [Candidatus Brocadiia bacterium]